MASAPALGAGDRGFKSRLPDIPSFYSFHMKLLSDVLDRKNYLRLIRVFGGTRVWVPKTGNPGHREPKVFYARAESIAQLREKGWSVSRLAAWYDLSKKRVYTILRNYKRRKSPYIRADGKNIKEK